jgi:hypothetical protein
MANKSNWYKIVTCDADDYVLREEDIPKFIEKELYVTSDKVKLNTPKRCIKYLKDQEIATCFKIDCEETIDGRLLVNVETFLDKCECVLTGLEFYST